MSSAVQWVAAAIFATAILHTFSTRFFERLAHERPQHAGMWHLLGEVEVVFGFWAMVLVLVTAMLLGTHSATAYLDSRDYTEPMFVFAIMVVAGSRAILQLARGIVLLIHRATPLAGATGLHFVTLAVVPLLGSVIIVPRSIPRGLLPAASAACGS